MTVIAERTEHVAGLGARARRLRRPEPVDRARRRDGDPRHLRARLGHADLRGPQRRGDRPRPRRRHAGARAGGRRRHARASPTSTPAKRALAEELGAAWAEPDEALRAEVDVVAPCALGGVLDHDHGAGAALPRGRRRGQQPARLGRARRSDLHARGILWAPDFVANAGGIINIAVELEPEGYSAERARDRVLAIGDTLRRCSTWPSAPARRRWRPRRSSRAGGSRRPARRSEGGWCSGNCPLRNGPGCGRRRVNAALTLKSTARPASTAIYAVNAGGDR